MSENRNGKFKKYSSHPRRRSRSTEAPESSNSRDDTVDGENLIFPGNSFTNPVSPRNDDFPDGVITRNVSSQGDNKTISEGDYISIFLCISLPNLLNICIIVSLSCIVEVCILRLEKW